MSHQYAPLTGVITNARSSHSQHRGQHYNPVELISLRSEQKLELNWCHNHWERNRTSSVEHLMWTCFLDNRTFQEITSETLAHAGEVGFTLVLAQIRNTGRSRDASASLTSRGERSTSEEPTGTHVTVDWSLELLKCLRSLSSMMNVRFTLFSRLWRHQTRQHEREWSHLLTQVSPS